MLPDFVEEREGQALICFNLFNEKLDVRLQLQKDLKKNKVEKSR